ncbi:MAG TPA: hypothetical protein VEH48_01510 [Candidatus Nitrosopolaris sp.]|nr:hypothetical protein [Candidatus Nitrosopolaris sp.]
MALLYGCGVFDHPILSTFAFTGIAAGGVLSFVTLPTNMTNAVFWIGAVLGLISALAGMMGIALGLDHLLSKRRIARSNLRFSKQVA